MEPVVNVREHGVIADGITGNTARINGLIREMDGGGVLYFPPGRYVTGPILLKSNITLRIATGAVILASEDKAEYPMIVEALLPGYGRGGHLALITAFREENIVIEGGGSVRDILMSNLLMEDVLSPFTVNGFYFYDREKLPLCSLC